MPNKNWLPGARTPQLAMCRDWIDVLTTGNKAFAWNVPDSRVTGLENAATEADSSLTLARNETTRTSVVNAQCAAAFHAMVELMRDTKNRYFLSPPLTNPDYISLGLKPHDTTPTHSGAPTAQVIIETYLVGRHQLGIRVVYVSGDPQDPANKGFRVYFLVRKPGESAPAGPEELTKSFYTKRLKDLMEFENGDSGSTAYFAVQIEHNGKKGPWGQMTSALIP